MSSQPAVYWRACNIPVLAFPSGVAFDTVPWMRPTDAPPCCDCRHQCVSIADARRHVQIRDDKKAEDASGPDYVVSLFNAQTRKAAL